MIRSSVDAHVHFKHSSEEVAALADAIVPLHDNILAVSSPYERGMMRKILNGHYFRQRDADRMRDMLIRAVKHSRANLQDYFPIMRASVLAQAQELEDAVTEYWADFIAAAIEAQPTH
jgi:hypothetical protein